MRFLLENVSNCLQKQIVHMLYLLRSSARKEKQNDLGAEWEREE